MQRLIEKFNNIFIMAIDPPNNLIYEIKGERRSIAMSKIPKAERNRLKRQQAIAHSYLLAVDPGSSHHSGVLYSPTRQPLTDVLTIHNNREGFEQLENLLKNLQAHHPDARVVFAIEASGEYWRPLHHYFKERGFETVFVPPLFVKRTREIDDYTPRASDPKDTICICNLAYEGRYFCDSQHAAVFQNLYQVVRAWDQVTQQLARTRLRLRSLLAKYFPEYPGIFSNLLGTTSLEVLKRWPFPQDLRQVPYEVLYHALRQISRKQLKVEKINLLWQKAHTSVGITTGLAGARIRLKLLLEEAEFYKQKAAIIMKQIAQILNQIHYVPKLRSIVGVGHITIAQLLAYTGDWLNFSHYNQIIDLAGLDLIFHDSGHYRSKKQISHRGRKHLRCILFLINRNYVRYPNTGRRKYLRLRLQGKSHREAIVATIPHLVRTIFAVVHGNTYYRPPFSDDPLCQEIAQLEKRWHERKKLKRKLRSKNK
ncbi:MAG: IS110 family transposase [Methanobacteriota archaeon]|nr:MAG: IS110 family transposase [Euryarchaeota archaeon]